jgi:hypothetical protein
MSTGWRAIISNGNNPGFLGKNRPYMALNTVRSLGKIHCQFHVDIVEFRLFNQFFYFFFLGNQFGKIIVYSPNISIKISKNNFNEENDQAFLISHFYCLLNCPRFVCTGSSKATTKSFGDGDYEI